MRPVDSQVCLTCTRGARGHSVFQERDACVRGPGGAAGRRGAAVRGRQAGAVGGAGAGGAGAAAGRHHRGARLAGPAPAGAAPIRPSTKWLDSLSSRMSGGAVMRLTLPFCSSIL